MGGGNTVNFNTIFFDIGNTLFFYNYEFLRDLLTERFGMSVSTKELREKHEATKRSLVADKLFNLPHDELWWEAYRRWLKSVGAEEDQIKPISEAIRNHPFRHMFWSRTEEGTKEMLDWFRERGFKLGVISNAEGQIRRLIEHAGLGDRFDVIVDSGVVGFVKPDERIFKHAMERMNASPDSSIHVGDIFDIDVVGAKKAGLTPILVDPNELHEKPECITVKRAVDLPKLSIFTD